MEILTTGTLCVLGDLIAMEIERILYDPSSFQSDQTPQGVSLDAVVMDLDIAAKELGFGGFWTLLENEGLGTEFEVDRLRAMLSEELR